MNSKIITAPNGVLFRAEHILSVSPVCKPDEAGEVGYFAVYVIGCDEPYLLCAQHPGGDLHDFENEVEQAEATEKAQKEFVQAWADALKEHNFQNN